MKSRTIQLGAHKLPLPLGASSDDRRLHAWSMLSRVLSQGTVVAFVGSGCSRALGYPSWKELTGGLVDATIASLEESPSVARSELEKYEGFKKALERRRKVQPASLMFYISACQQTLRESDPARYREYFEREFSDEEYYRARFNKNAKKRIESDRHYKKRFLEPPARADESCNPLARLLELPIHRFVTTNYDSEIEQALARKHDLTMERFGIGASPAEEQTLLSFTQEDRYHRELARFALARVPGNRHMVFHCHGRFDREHSIIASEADYQKYYLADRGASGYAFRQTLQLLLRSNPLLFVGYSLSDDDPLRPLRQLGAIEPEAKASRPLFALLEAPRSPDDPEELHREEQLFERYGVRAISYPGANQGADERERAHALCQALGDLETHYLSATRQWVEKPLAKRPPTATCSSRCRLLGVDPAAGETLGVGCRAAHPLHDLRPGLLGLVGPSGSGKSMALARAVNALSLSEGDPARSSLRAAPFAGTSFPKIFLWNAYFENEALTGLDLVLSFLDPDNRTRGPRHRRLLHCLRTQKALLILDGCERLLHVRGRARGRSLSITIRSLFEVLADRESLSTVILAGRIWPEELRELAERDARIRHVQARSLDTDDLLANPLFQRLNDCQQGRERRLVSALCSLLDGHHYGVLLAERYLHNECAPEMTDERLCEAAIALHGRLAERPPKKRLAAMIECSLEQLERRFHGAREALERLAFFRGPIVARVAKICCQKASHADGGDDLLAELQKQLFIFPAAVDGDRSSAYLVYDPISSYFTRKSQVGRSEMIPSFAQPGTTAAAAGIQPGGRERSNHITELFEQILDAAEGKDAVPLCRSAFTLVRSQMECSSAPGWTDFDRYSRFGIRIAELAKKISPATWSFGTRLRIAEVEHVDAPLYIGELAWLYTDVGLALFSEGLMADAFSVWEQAYEINRVIEGAERPGETVSESLLNLAHCLIELGRLWDAEDYLDDAEEINDLVGSESLEARIAGFKGLTSHLKGNLEQADTYYARCLDRLDQEVNPRAASFFHVHRCLLHIERDDLVSARQSARTARAFAEATQSSDLLAYSRIAEADLLLTARDPAAARPVYIAAFEEAARCKARKIQALIAFKLSELARSQGDLEGAREKALDGLGLSNELGLGLLQTRGLIALGRSIRESGSEELGTEYLRIARDQARMQQYWLRYREAERLLSERPLRH